MKSRASFGTSGPCPQTRSPNELLGFTGDIPPKSPESWTKRFVHTLPIYARDDYQRCAPSFLLYRKNTELGLERR